MTDEQSMSFNLALGDAMWALLGDDWIKSLPSMLDEGQIADMAGEGMLIAWPKTIGPVMMLIEPGPDGRNYFAGAWPVQSSVERYDLVVDEVLRDEDRPSLALLRCSWHGALIDVFDARCRASALAVKPGDTVSATLHGWAISMGPATSEPMMVDTSQWGQAVSDLFADSIGKDGSLRLEIADMSMLIGCGGDPSPLHEVRGVISAIGPAYEIPGTAYRRLTMTVTSISDGDQDHDLVLDITVTDRVWQEEWPDVGDAVTGVVWIEAMLNAVSPTW